jgi:CRISPR/Cas system-associated exonuclease Cas4 (RecB family)
MAVSKLAKLIREASKPKDIEEEFVYAYFKRFHDLQKPRVPRKGMFSPSSLSNSCLRHLYYRYIGTPEEAENRPVLDFGPILSILQNGNDRHERIQEIFSTVGKSGFDFEWIDVADYLEEFKPPHTEIVEKVGFETKLFNSVLPSRFMCDGIFKFDGKYYILEIKTMNNRKWSGAKGEGKPLKDHLLQGTTYGLILGIDNVLFVYENRDNMKLLPFLHKIEPEDKQTIIDITSAVKTYAELEKLPPKTSNVKEDCRWCKYKTLCNNAGFTKSAFEAHPILDNPEARVTS